MNDSLAEHLAQVGGVDSCAIWHTECVTQTAHNVQLSLSLELVTSCVLKCLSRTTTPSESTAEGERGGGGKLLLTRQAYFPTMKRVPCLLKVAWRGK